MAGKDRQIGFARVLTDGVTTFYLMDFVIEEKYRSQGFGTILMDRIMKENGHLYGMLHTKDAKAFYEKYGFRAIGDTKKTEEIYMGKTVQLKIAARFFYRSSRLISRGVSICFNVIS